MGNTQSYRLGKPVPLVVEHNGQKTTIPRNSDYQKTISSIKKNIRSLKAVSDHQVILLTLLKEVDDHVQITPDQWADFLPRLNLIRVKLDNELNASSVFSDNCRQCPTPLPPGEQIILITRMGRTTTYNVNLSTLTVYDLKELIDDKEGDPVGRQLLTFNGRRLMDKKRLADYGIKDGSTIQISSNICAKKPVIYLFPPNPTSNIQVDLSLNQAWSFSEIYPPTTITTLTENDAALGQAITWTIDAQPDGTLRDQSTGRAVSYLFWEAQINPNLPMSPPATRPSSPVEQALSSFDPTSPVLLPSQSALLPFDKVTGYIDDVLLVLGLHTEARTSFITYWLPDLSKHTFIALRFLPQEEYERAAPLNVIPAPDVKTRVFMLFMGIEENQIELWDQAAAMARKDVKVWRDVVGIDITKVHDKSLFRVLEWGGMEV